MTLTDLLLNIKKSSFEELIPISELQTEEDLNKYRERGYDSSLTALKIKEMIKGINLENVFFQKNLIDPYIYFDKKEYLIVSLNIFNGECFLNEEAKNDFEGSLNKTQKRNEGKLSRNLMICPEALRLSLLNYILQNKEMSPELYDAFIDCYCDNDFGANNLSQQSIERVTECKSEEQKNKTKDKLKKFPNSIKVYRGEGNASTPYDKAYSWTIDYNTALLFACRMGDKGQVSGRLIEGRVKKEDVIEYISKRGESEILTLPQKVTVTNVMELDSAKELEQSEEMEFILDNYGCYTRSLRSLEFSHDTEEHGKLHTLRVGFLAMLLGHRESINDEEMELLLEACLYHDIERTNDKIDDEHGKKAAEFYREEFGAWPELEFLLTYHCLKDAEAKKVYDRTDFSEEVDVWKVYQILKDADALDRVRFGIRGLDTNQLRLKESLKLPLLATQLINGLKL